MGDKSKIEWTESSFNPVRGCSRISPGCQNCYAERYAARFCGAGETDQSGEVILTAGPFHTFATRTPSGPRWTGKVALIPEKLTIPYHWKRGRRVFVCSLSDLFHEDLPFGSIALVWAAMAAAPQHDYQVLTKRASRLPEFFEWLKTVAASHAATLTNGQPFTELDVLNFLWLQAGGPCALPKQAWPLPHVSVGVSVEDQPRADERIPHLLRTPAAARWISYEPALGPVDFENINLNGDSLNALTGEVCSSETTCICDDFPSLDWIVVGGESGPGARPMHPDWPRRVRDQCQKFGNQTPFFFKQNGEYLPASIAHQPSRLVWLNTDGRTINSGDPEEDEIRSNDGWKCMGWVGKKAAGRVLDGRTWDEYPETERTATR